MSKRKLITVKDKNYLLKETIVENDGSIVWHVTDPKTKNYFIVHTNSIGRLYISFFKGCRISRECSLHAIRKICDILLKRSLKPTIKISCKNEALIVLCKRVGFRKVNDVRDLYYLKKLK